MECKYERHFFVDGEEIELWKTIKNGSDQEKIAARNRIASGYYPAVIQVAKKHPYATRHNLDELVQIGMLALIERVIPRYDPERKIKFITYCMVCVWKHLQQSLTKHKRKGIVEFVQGQFHDVVADDNAEDFQDSVSFREELNVVTSRMRQLNSRDRMVIEMRYGLNGRQQSTLKEVGEVLGVTRERVRQIQDRAQRTLAKAI